MRSAEAFLAVLATSAVIWWVVGDLSEPDGYLVMFDAPWAGVNATVIGLAGLMILGVCLRALRRSASTTIGWVTTIGLALGTGVVLGLGLRTVSAATDGANIGGGGFVLLGLPFVVGLTLVTMVLAAVTGRAEHSDHQSQMPGPPTSTCGNTGGS